MPCPTLRYVPPCVASSHSHQSARSDSLSAAPARGWCSTSMQVYHPAVVRATLDRLRMAATAFIDGLRFGLTTRTHQNAAAGPLTAKSRRSHTRNPLWATTPGWMPAHHAHIHAVVTFFGTSRPSALRPMAWRTPVTTAPAVQASKENVRNGPRR